MGVSAVLRGGAAWVLHGCCMGVAWVLHRCCGGGAPPPHEPSGLALGKGDPARVGLFDRARQLTCRLEIVALRQLKMSHSDNLIVALRQN